MAVNKNEGKKVAKQYVNGDRTWFLTGSFTIEDGFTLLPIPNDELDLSIDVDTPTISRTITEKEVAELMKSPHCKNKEAVEFLVQEIERLRSEGKGKEAKSK